MEHMRFQQIWDQLVATRLYMVMGHMDDTKHMHNRKKAAWMGQSLRQQTMLRVRQGRICMGARQILQTYWINQTPIERVDKVTSVSKTQRYISQQLKWCNQITTSEEKVLRLMQTLDLTEPILLTEITKTQRKRHLLQVGAYKWIWQISTM